MTFQEWQPQWARLAHFHVSGDTDRGQLEAEWFAQLKHWHVDAVDHGVTKLIGGARDNFLPGLGLLKDHIQTRIGRYARTPGKCSTCHGSGWVDARPIKSNGMIYTQTARCPDCGIPAPQVESHGRYERPTDIEIHEWQEGRYLRDTMPDGLKAKPWDDAKRATHKAQMMAAFEALRVKLFGHGEDAA